MARHDEHAFGRLYAGAYDRLYEDKDYDAECDLIERLIRRYAVGPAVRILDLGCGTGSHAIRLARRGYEVVGVDRSPWMVAEAERKIAGLEAPGVTVRQADIRDVDLRGPFDAALMMFAVLGYQTTDRDVIAALGSARRHLRPGGLLLFDVWFGPAVERRQSTAGVRVVPDPAGPIRRESSASLDRTRHVVSVEFRLARSGAAPPAATTEIHRVRYFFSEELAAFLSQSGLQLVRLGAFPDFERDPDDGTRSVLVLARAV